MHLITLSKSHSHPQKADADTISNGYANFKAFKALHLNPQLKHLT